MKFGKRKERNIEEQNNQETASALEKARNFYDEQARKYILEYHGDEAVIKALAMAAIDAGYVANNYNCPWFNAIYKKALDKFLNFKPVAEITEKDFDENGDCTIPYQEDVHYDKETGIVKDDRRVHFRSILSNGGHYLGILGNQLAIHLIDELYPITLPYRYEDINVYGNELPVIEKGKVIGRIIKVVRIDIPGKYIPACEHYVFCGYETGETKRLGRTAGRKLWVEAEKADKEEKAAINSDKTESVK